MIPSIYSRRKRHDRQKAFLLLLIIQSVDVSNGWGPLRLASRIAAATKASSSITGSNNKHHRLAPTRPIRHALGRVISFQSFPRDDSDWTVLQSENTMLRDIIRQLEEENLRLKQRAQRVIGLENFEGERFFRGEMDTSFVDTGGITLTGEEIIQDEMWCDELDGDQCPVEPTITFGEALHDQTYWLVGLFDGWVL